MKYNRQTAIRLHDDLVDVSRKIVKEYNDRVLGVALNNGGNWKDAKFFEFKLCLDEMNKDIMNTMKEINRYSAHLLAKIREYE